MDIAGLAAMGVGMQMAQQKQDFSVQAVKAAVENKTQAAQVLTEQVTEQAKAAAGTATAGRIDIIA